MQVYSSVPEIVELRIEPWRDLEKQESCSTEDGS
jgi:hypothetical protein